MRRTRCRARSRGRSRRSRTSSATSSCGRGCSGSPTTRRSRSCAAGARRRSSATSPGDDAEMEDRVSEREELRVLRHDLADLPDRQRAALVLRELNGLSHAEIGTVLELSPAAVKQAIFEARTALFSCREGREMACHDVRRMLSDGDGRVLRGRGVRAHLRSCPDCRRFQSRPRASPGRAADARPAAAGRRRGDAALAAARWLRRRPSCWRASRSRAAARRSPRRDAATSRSRNGTEAAVAKPPEKTPRGRPRRAPRQDERAAAGRARPVGARGGAAARRKHAEDRPRRTRARPRAEAGRGRRRVVDGRSAGQAEKPAKPAKAVKPERTLKPAKVAKPPKPVKIKAEEAAQAGEGDAARPGQEGRRPGADRREAASRKGRRRSTNATAELASRGPVRVCLPPWQANG